MTPTKNERAAEKIVQAIYRDFTDRRGLRQAWDTIDDELQAEILAEWKRIVLSVLTERP